MLIKEVRARKIKDSRREDTIEVSVNECKASSPSGKSTGKFETPSYHKSINWNIKSINSLKFDFEINSFADLKKVENLIKKKFKLKDAKQFGANALFALESAILKALAKSEKKELWQVINPKAKDFPVPIGNAIGGGKHSEDFKVHPIFQEFLLIPHEKTFEKNVAVMKTIYNELGRILNAKEKNDEGAWQVPADNEQILEVLEKFRNKIRFGADIASSTFYNAKTNQYDYGNKELDKNSQIHYINALIDKFHLFYVEDPIEENDFIGFSKIKKNFLVAGDDLTATHITRLKRAIKSKSINAMIIKPNQNGSLLELKEIFTLCRTHKFKTILSHRSGETLDPAIADYAFAFGADFIKTGIATPWREAKLNRMIEIERSLRK